MANGPTARSYFGRRVRRAGAGRAEPLEHLLEQPVGRVVGDLHLELAEPGRDPASRQHRHLVVDHLADSRSVEIEQLDQSPDGSQADDGPRSPSARTRGSVDRLVGRGRRVLAGERELASDEQVAAVPLGGSFVVHPCPSRWRRLTPHRARRKSARIEVHGLQPLGVVGDRQDVFAQTRRAGACGTPAEAASFTSRSGDRRHLALSSASRCRCAVRLDALHGRHLRPSRRGRAPRRARRPPGSTRRISSRRSFRSRSTTSVTHSTR